jgi:hypothetical protein
MKYFQMIDLEDSNSVSGLWRIFSYNITSGMIIIIDDIMSEIELEISRV